MYEKRRKVSCDVNILIVELNYIIACGIYETA